MNTNEKIFESFNTHQVDNVIENEYYNPLVEERTKFEKIVDWWNAKGHFNMKLYIEICKIKGHEIKKEKS